MLIGAILTRAYFLNLWFQDINQQQESLRLQLVNLISANLSKHRDISKALFHNMALQNALANEHEVHTETLEQIFIEFSRTSPSISQLRWIDINGQEAVRVNKDLEGRVIIVRGTDLQNKSQRDYIVEARKTKAGQVYLSRIDLNIEQGKVVTPYQPTQRTVIPTSQPLHAGFLIINFDLTSLFKALSQYSSEEHQLQLLDEDGQWLIHPEPDKAWGLILPHGQTLQHHDIEQWQQISRTSSDSLWQHQKIVRSYYKVNQQPRLFMLLETSPSHLSTGMLRLNIYTTLFALALMILGSAIIRQLFTSAEIARRLADKLLVEKEQLASSHKELQQAFSRQQQLQDSLVEARRLSSLGMTVAGVAHQLNTPSSGVALAISAMKQQLHKLENDAENGLTRSSLENYISISQEGLTLASINLKKLKEQLNSFKRLAIERADSQIRQVSLLQLVTDIEATIRPRLKTQNISLHIDINDDITITTDTGILSQTLQNLLDNALQHAFEQGQNGNINIKAFESQQGITIIVEDDGRGISPTLRDSVFAPFITSARGKGNTGLGLHLVHQWITQKLKGNIALKSMPGKGCRFTLMIPKVIDDETEQSPATPPSTEPDAVS